MGHFEILVPFLDKVSTSTYSFSCGRFWNFGTYVLLGACKWAFIIFEKHINMVYMTGVSLFTFFQKVFQYMYICLFVSQFHRHTNIHMHICYSYYWWGENRGTLTSTHWLSGLSIEHSLLLLPILATNTQAMMASKVKDEASLNQQIEELRERMRILRKFRIYMFLSIPEELWIELLSLCWNMCLSCLSLSLSIYPLWTSVSRYSPLRVPLSVPLCVSLTVADIGLCYILYCLSCLYFAENDRKSNIDVLEANKNSNKDDIKRLRDDNKDLRQKLAQLQKVSALPVCSNTYKSIVVYVFNVILHSFII